MGDERAVFGENDAAVLAEALEDEAVAADPLDAMARPNLHTEILRIRWDTPRGQLATIKSRFT